MTNEEYKKELISQLESSVAFLDHMCRKAMNAPDAERTKIFNEWSSARDQLFRARQMRF